MTRQVARVNRKWTIRRLWPEWRRLTEYFEHALLESSRANRLGYSKAVFKYWQAWKEFEVVRKAERQ